jgi:hypothetical protein
METPTQGLRETLIQRVESLVQSQSPIVEWGNPLLSTTPTSIAVRELAMRTEALELALREIALEVQKLSSNS